VRERPWRQPSYLPGRASSDAPLVLDEPDGREPGDRDGQPGGCRLMRPVPALAGDGFLLGGRRQSYISPSGQTTRYRTTYCTSNESWTLAQRVSPRMTRCGGV
jgi:hypothetical protein